MADIGNCVGNAVTIVTLAPLDEAAHGAEIRAITAIPSVMKWVADGQLWSAAKYRRFFQYCAAEEKQDPGERVNFYSAVLEGPSAEEATCVGVVGIHPIEHDQTARGRPSLTIFLSPDVCGRGVGTRAIRAALDDYWARKGVTATDAVSDSVTNSVSVTIDVRADNYAMLRVAEKMGLARTGSPRIAGRNYRRFEAAPDRR